MSACPATELALRPRRAPAVTDAASFAGVTARRAAQMADLEAFRALLSEWNERMNLVGPSALRGVLGPPRL